MKVISLVKVKSHQTLVDGQIPSQINHNGKAKVILKAQCIKSRHVDIHVQGRVVLVRVDPVLPDDDLAQMYNSLNK